MSSWFRICRRHLILGVAGGLALFAFAGPTAHAGTLTITISKVAGVHDADDVIIFFQNGNAGLGGDDHHVTADLAAVNSELDSKLYGFNITALGAIDNSPASGSDASLFLTGQVFRTTGGGPASITFEASQNDFASLAGSPGTMKSFSTANFVGAPGGISQDGTSFFGPTNAQNDTGGPMTAAPTLFPPGGSTPEPPVGVLQSSAFSLTNRITVTLAGDTSGGTNPPIDQFTHTSTVTAAIPEPASVAMMGMGMPVAFMSLVWLRRRRAIAAR